MARATKTNSKARRAGPDGAAAGPDLQIPIQAEPPKRYVLDRMLVLLIGIAVGVTIGFAFSHTSSVNASTLTKVSLTRADDKELAGAPTPKPARKLPRAEAIAAATAAGEAADCATPVSPRLLRTVARNEPVKIGVFGDSFGEGVWEALYWGLPKNQNYQVIKFAERATGFTRYRSMNLEEKVASDIAARPVDIAVISFGANDTQGISDGQHVYALLTPGWKAVYGERMARYVNLLREQGAMVYWIGLPKMRNPEFDAQVESMNQFFAERMEALNVPFLATTELSVDDAGAFNNYLVDRKTNEEKLMRANDGVHMTFAGYSRITAPLVQRIRAYVAHSKDVAATSLPKEAVGEQLAAQAPRPGL
ncbi:hypothetical protein BH11PSE2_BH11PSE2_11290 [soil metagenome]